MQAGKFHWMSKCVVYCLTAELYYNIIILEF